MNKTQADIVNKKKRLNQLIQLLTISFNGTQMQMYEMFQNQDKDKVTKLWNISFRQFQKYLKQAYQIMSNPIDKSTEYYIKRSKKRYDDLFGKMYRQQDYKGALQAQKGLETLIGLGSSNSGVVINNTVNQLPNKLVIEVVETSYDDYKVKNATTDNN